MKRFIFSGLISAFALMWGLPSVALDVKKPSPDGVIEQNIAYSDKPLVIIWSGDGGWWGDLDAQLAGEFADSGYPVVGLDTNMWFGTERTVADTAQKFSDMVTTYAQKTRSKRVVVLGWSYGADVLSIAYNASAPAVRNKVTSLVFLALSKTTQLQVTLAERMGLDKGDIVLEPELLQVPRKKFICVYGDQEEDETGCLTDAADGATKIVLPGGHFYDHDAKGIVKRLQPLIDAQPLAR